MSTLVRIESEVRNVSEIYSRQNQPVRSDSLNIPEVEHVVSPYVTQITSEPDLSQRISALDSEGSDNNWIDSIRWGQDKLTPAVQLAYQIGKKAPVLTFDGLNIAYEYKQLTKYKAELDKHIFPSQPTVADSSKISSWISPYSWYTYWNQSSNSQNEHTSNYSSILQNPLNHVKDMAYYRLNIAVNNIQKMTPIELSQIGASAINLGRGIYKGDWAQAGLEVYSIGKKILFKKKDPNEKFKEIKLTDHIDGFTALTLTKHVSDGAESCYKIYKSVQNIFDTFLEISPLASKAYLGIQDISKVAATNVYDKGVEVYTALKDGVENGGIYDTAQELLIGEYDSISQESAMASNYQDNSIEMETLGCQYPWEFMYGVSGA